MERNSFRFRRKRSTQRVQRAGDFIGNELIPFYSMNWLAILVPWRSGFTPDSTDHPSFPLKNIPSVMNAMILIGDSFPPRTAWDCNVLRLST